VYDESPPMTKPRINASGKISHCFCSPPTPSVRINGKNPRRP